MTDLTAQIRATLDAWSHPVAIIEHPEPLAAEEYADLVARFQAAQQGPHVAASIAESPRVTAPFDRMRDALLAIVDMHKPIEHYCGPDDITYSCSSCRYFTGEWPCPHMEEIAEKLGIEATDV